VMHVNESLFLDQNCAGVVLFSGWLPSFRRESSDLPPTCPSLKQVFCLGVPKAGCSELSLGILAGSNVQLRPNTCTVAGKSLNRFQPTLRSGRRTLPGRRQRIPGTFPVGRSDNGSRRKTDAANLAVRTMAECQPDFHRNRVYEGETESIFTGFSE
jgi:hypothetical protein